MRRNTMYPPEDGVGSQLQNCCEPSGRLIRLQIEVKRPVVVWTFVVVVLQDRAPARKPLLWGARAPLPPIRPGRLSSCERKAPNHFPHPPILQTPCPQTS